MVVTDTFDLNWPRAHGDAVLSAVTRACNADFQVDEILTFTPDGEGEHVYLHVRKDGANTQWVAKQLARFAGVRNGDVAYAGLKDRHAITTQWFSVHLPGSEPLDWQAADIEGVEILQTALGRRKLRTGALKGNRFQLRLTELEGDREAIEARLQTIAEQGVPNYYGGQRFGHDAGNLQGALRVFQGERIRDRRLKGLYLSAARSWLFNQVLAERVREGIWATAMNGDVYMLDGRSACFADDGSDNLAERLAAGELHLTGPLWGRGESMATGWAKNLEDRVLQSMETWREGLEAAGMEQERRSLRMRVGELQWEWPDDQSLLLSFTLPSGSFATTVLAELM